MKRRSFLATALAPLVGRASELPEAQIIYAHPWTREYQWRHGRDELQVREFAHIWVHPRERECHAREYEVGYTLTAEQIINYPTVKAQMELALARNKRAIERDLLAMPIDWHGQLKRRKDES